MSLTLWIDALRVLVPDIVDECLADGMDRPELIALATAAWRQIEPSAVYWLDSVPDWAPMHDVCPALEEWSRNAPMVPECLCGHDDPQRAGWLEWMAVLIAALALLWDTERRQRPFTLFGVTWHHPLPPTPRSEPC